MYSGLTVFTDSPLTVTSQSARVYRSARTTVPLRGRENPRTSIPGAV